MVALRDARVVAAAEGLKAAAAINDWLLDQDSGE